MKGDTTQHNIILVASKHYSTESIHIATLTNPNKKNANTVLPRNNLTKTASKKRAFFRPVCGCGCVRAASAARLRCVHSASAGARNCVHFASAGDRTQRDFYL